MGARFGKLGCPGDGGSADRLTVTLGLNSLAWTPTTLGFFCVSARTAPSAGSSLWIRLRARSMFEVVPAVVVAAGLVAVVAAGLIGAVTAGLVAVVAVAGLATVVTAGLTAVVVTAGLVVTVVAGLTAT